MTVYKPAVSEGLRFLLARQQGSIHTQVHRLIKTRRGGDSSTYLQGQLLEREGGLYLCMYLFQDISSVFQYPLTHPDQVILGVSIFQQYFGNYISCQIELRIKTKLQIHHKNLQRLHCSYARLSLLRDALQCILQVGKGAYWTHLSNQYQIPPRANQLG